MVVEYEEIPEESSCFAAGSPQDTARLVVDRARKDDVADILFLANNRRIAEKLTNMPHPFTYEDAKALVKRCEVQLPSQATFAIRMKNTGRFIGAIGFNPLAEDFGAVHLGYWVGEPFWNQGYATEAVQSVIEFAFANGVKELSASCRVSNPASHRVLTKCGFKQDGATKLHSLGAMAVVDATRFTLTRTQWIANTRWGSAG
ncbi:GNAT family N-acetyltransferase [Pseudovibrio brasiliensis]|uniref:GNAT family N-acetyltransferase n=1 Tax=Pseudovibrio brasiliensis TaxID=1898042 RepID=A0ABX8AMG7_9HYPH|nr:GNAT family N-acetyltransferase [Pseudovibrio brasiliensis]QUS56183.1 GNAT family N-acetyltransferase [Pseudovibrio brasiliensis]